MDSLNKVCYEQIKDTFYKGLFGDFPLIVDKKRAISMLLNYAIRWKKNTIIGNKQSVQKN